MVEISLPDDSLTAPVTVHVVDDNPDIRETASRLIRSIGVAVATHGGGAEFLKDYDPHLPGCVVLDVAMPGISGFQVHDVLNGLDVPPPVIFVTGHAEVPLAVEAMRAGAIDFLIKPFCAETLLERVHEAVHQDLCHRQEYALSGSIHCRVKKLSRRERQIAKLLSKGDTVKHIAHDLGLSPKTVENHRARVLEKLEVDNPTQLANLVSHLPEFAGS